MSQGYRSAPAKRFAIPEPAWQGTGQQVRRLEQRAYRQLVLRAFYDEIPVADARLVTFADLVYQAGLRAGRAEAEVRLYREGYAAGKAEAEAERAAGDYWR